MLVNRRLHSLYTIQVLIYGKRKAMDLKRRLYSIPDAHCHLQDSRYCNNISVLRKIISNAEENNVKRLASCASFPEEWNQLEIIMKDYSQSIKLVPCFAIHPWWANTMNDSVHDELERILQKYPNAAVGEIGMCQSKRGKEISLEIQERVFSMQFTLGMKMNRPIVIHWVKNYDKLTEFLKRRCSRKEECRSPIIIHSFSGSLQQMNQLLKVDLNIYFSFSANQLCGTRISKAIDCLKNVPLDYLLLETDSPDQFPYDKLHEINSLISPVSQIESNLKLNEPSVVQLAFKIVCEKLNIEEEILCEKLNCNFYRAFSII